MSLQRLEHRLAALLSSDDLVVTPGPPTAPTEAAPTAGVVVESIVPRPTMGARRPTELEPRLLRRISPITARVTITVNPRTGADGRGTDLRLATELWWRCDDVELTSGAAFPDDPDEGYAVDSVALRGLATADQAIDVDGPGTTLRGVHRIELDVDGAVWPRELEPEAGQEIRFPTVRLAAAAPARYPGVLSVVAGETLTVHVELDLRSFVLSDPDDPGPVPDAPGPDVRARVEALGDAPAGALDDGDLTVVDDRLAVDYTAGSSPGRDRVVFELVDQDGIAIPAGAIDVEVRA